ncbi:hypothetical protein G6F45_014317 [Rhizopus arrhizus]|nr:hypothetical protein G6F45_014317 [Rhizopus arrhizus]
MSVAGSPCRAASNLFQTRPGDHHEAVAPVACHPAVPAAERLRWHLLPIRQDRRQERRRSHQRCRRYGQAGH